MCGVDAYAEGFVAAVFADDAFPELSGDQEREAVPGFGATDTA